MFSFYELSIKPSDSTGYDEAARTVIANFLLPGTKFTCKVTHELKVLSAVAFPWPCGLHETCANAGMRVCVCLFHESDTGVGTFVSWRVELHT